MKRNTFHKYPSLFPSSVRSFKYDYFKYKKITNNNSPHQCIPSNKNSYSFYKDIYPVFDAKEFLVYCMSHKERNRSVDILRSKIPINVNKLKNTLIRTRRFEEKKGINNEKENILNEEVNKIAHRKDCSVLVRKILSNEDYYKDDVFTKKDRLYFKSDKPLNFYDKYGRIDYKENNRYYHVNALRFYREVALYKNRKGKEEDKEKDKEERSLCVNEYDENDYRVNILNSAGIIEEMISNDNDNVNDNGDEKEEEGKISKRKKKELIRCKSSITVYDIDNKQKSKYDNNNYVYIKEHFNNIGKDIYNINNTANENFYNQYYEFMDKIFTKKKLKEIYRKHYGTLRQPVPPLLPSSSLKQ